MKKNKTVDGIFKNYNFDTDECVNWNDKPNVSGYGQTWCNGKNNLAHRLAFEHFNGEIEQGKEVAHTCHNRMCINPDHLILLTHQENIKHSYSDKNPRKKRHYLTTIQVEYIRDNEMEVNTAIIAKKYNISRQTVYRIKSGLTGGKKA